MITDRRRLQQKGEVEDIIKEFCNFRKNRLNNDVYHFNGVDKKLKHYLRNYFQNL